MLAAHKGDKEVSPVIEGKESGIIMEMTDAKLGFIFIFIFLFQIIKA